MMAARAVILPARRLHAGVAVAPFDAARRGRQRQRKRLAELGDQRSQSLPAGDRGVAVLGADLVDRGDLLQILAGKIGAEHEFGGARPVAEFLRHHGSAGDVDLAARGFVDGAVGLDQRRQKILGLAGAGVAAADADFLPRRRRHDVEPRGARELDHRIGLGIVDPARAAIERHVEGRAVGNAAAAGLARRLHHDHLAVRRHRPAAPRRCPRHRRRSRLCQPRAATALPLPVGPRPASRQGPRPPRGKRGASLSCHGFRGLEACENMLRTLPYSHGHSNHHGELIMIDRRRR